MAKKLAMQDIILTLQQFWAKQGCMLMQAYDNEKGAGTMSPYTFLRAIGPEPWNVAYVEPSRRPADGRLWRKSQSFVPAPPISGNHETESFKHPGSLLGFAQGFGNRFKGTRYSVC